LYFLKYSKAEFIEKHVDQNLYSTHLDYTDVHICESGFGGVCHLACENTAT